MAGQTPIVSVLITTFNRSRLLRRAVVSVLDQTFKNLELIVIDDCSSDDTEDVIRKISDDRVRYIRNATNIGALHGDRPHVRHFVYELMRGKYFVYLCDDDYWIPPDLLARQVALLDNKPDLAFVFGNQLSQFMTDANSHADGAVGGGAPLTPATVAKYLDPTTNRSKSPQFGYYPRLFPKTVMSSEEYLEHFSREPTTYNRIVGATLYSRAHFVQSGAMRTEKGSSWQAGYEFLLGPACSGGVAFLDEPCVLTEVREKNASFQGTQVEHYLDSIKSIDLAFAVPVANANASRKRFFRRIKAETTRNLTHAFLGNTITIRATGQLGMCGAENMAHPVTFRQVLPVYAGRRVVPKVKCALLLLGAGSMPSNRTPAAAVLLRAARWVRPRFAAALAGGRGEHHGR